jgi:hypothetical protein
VLRVVSVATVALVVSRVVSDAIVELVWEDPVAPGWLLLVAPRVSLLVVVLLTAPVAEPATAPVAATERWSR